MHHPTRTTTKKIRLDPAYLTEWFAQTIHYWSNVYATGIWSPEDIYQECLLRLSQKEYPDRPVPSRHHKGQICRVDPGWVIIDVRRVCQKIRRGETLRLVRGEVPRSLPATRHDPVAFARIVEAVTRLPEDERAVVFERLRGVHGDRPAPLRVVGGALGLSKATVSRRLSSARSLLEDSLLETPTRGPGPGRRRRGS